MRDLFISRDNKLLWGLYSLMFQNLETSRLKLYPGVVKMAAEKEVRSDLIGLQILLNYNFSTQRNHGFNILLLTDLLP